MLASTVVILAAGEGTRMRSALPKVLHPILGRPMILWPVLVAQRAGAGRVVVIDGPDRALDGILPDSVQIAVQQEPKAPVTRSRPRLRTSSPTPPSSSSTATCR
jgi:bifunctional UDP-N-acetylglucosamine pyrophosphorylase/glucosamine-1-phosphate N-acetyltransferase